MAGYCVDEVMTSRNKITLNQIYFLWLNLVIWYLSKRKQVQDDYPGKNSEFEENENERFNSDGLYRYDMYAFGYLEDQNRSADC